MILLRSRNACAQRPDIGEPSVIYTETDFLQKTAKETKDWPGANVLQQDVVHGH
jgi:hypothetical protein